MKIPRITSASVLAALAALALCATTARAINYAGNGDTSFGGDIGNGVLSLTDDGTNIHGTVTCGNGGHMYNVLVIYVDNGTGNGFSTTANFSDDNDGNRAAISGYSGSGRSVMTFTNGFTPQVAIALGPSATSYGGIWKLANGGGNSLPYVDSANLTPLSSQGPFSFQFPASDLGLTSGVPATIKIFGTYISNSGYRSSEAVAGNDSGSAGWNPYAQTAYATYSFDAPVVLPQPVTFQVDMTAKIASGAFNPGNGDLVYAAGSFQTNPWSGFQLTPSVANTNIYVGTYLDPNPTNTAEQFKFNFFSVANNTNTWETLDNRPFTLQSGGQTLSLVYFDDVFPTPSATTNVLSFSIDMTPQIDLGNFNPANGDQIEVFGTLENPKWTAGFILTNNPNSSSSNIYSGTIADGNYPASFEEYKFVIIPNGASDVYESGNNRTFFTPTNAYTFPLAYFNNVTSAYSIPVTFQVDMTIPIATGAFHPGNGDTVSAAGTFQATLSSGQWKPGVFILTNNPTGTNSNLYTGTYIDQNTPGTFEQFKFQINSGGNTDWEGIGNRSFALASSAQTLPVVEFNNAVLSDYLLQPTAVFFSVDMAGAVGTDSHTFNPSSDNVYVNGQFAGWYAWAGGVNPSTAPPGYQMIEEGLTTIYTNTIIMPAGSSVNFAYKYGMDPGAVNGDPVDDEAPANSNHSRVVRSTTQNPYVLATDKFGYQYGEPYFSSGNPTGGNLTVGSTSGGTVSVQWLGCPGAQLAWTTNLSSTNWQLIAATDGTNWTTGYSSTNGFVSETNIPVNGAKGFYQLVKPY